jgi:hypothetical protein
MRVGRLLKRETSDHDWSELGEFDCRIFDCVNGWEVRDCGVVLWCYSAGSFPFLPFLSFPPVLLLCFYPLHSAIHFPSCFVRTVYWVCSVREMTVGCSRLGMSSQWDGHLYDPRAPMVAVSGNSRSGVSDFGFL